MVSDDIDICTKVSFYDGKVCTKPPNSALYMGKVSHYYDVDSIILVEIIDKQRNHNKMMKFSIELFRKNGNDVKSLKYLITIVSHDRCSNLFALNLCEDVIKRKQLMCIFKSREG